MWISNKQVTSLKTLSVVFLSLQTIPCFSYAFEPPKIVEKIIFPDDIGGDDPKHPIVLFEWDSRLEFPQIYGNGKLINTDIQGEKYINLLSYDGNIAIHGYEGVIYKNQDWDNPIYLHRERKNDINELNAVSSDGKVIGTGLIATIWYGDEWQQVKKLKTLYADTPIAFSSVTALSSSGNIAAGWMGAEPSEPSPTPYKRAVIWYGKNWENIIDLGTLDDNAPWPTHFNDHDKVFTDTNVRYFSTVSALNADGSVAVGRSWAIGHYPWTSYSWANEDKPLANQRGIVWYGDKWQNKKDLGSLKTDNTGYSGAYAISGDGQVIAGAAETDSGENIIHAVIWSTDSDGNPWAQKTDLGTLNNDDKTLISAAYSISADGSVVVGTSTTGEESSFGEKLKQILWKIKYYTEVPNTSNKEEGIEWITYIPKEAPKQKELPEGVPPEKPDKPKTPETATKPAAKPPVVTAMIDVPNTERSIIQMGHDTFELFSLQFGALRRLQEECVAGKGEICYALQHNYTAQNGNYDNAVNLRVGYGFTDNLTFGVNFDRSLRRSLPDTYRRLSGNGGMGVFGHYQLPYHAYIAAGIGWDYYRVQAQRPLLTNTEFAPTKSRVRGLAWNVTVGQDFTLSNDSQLGWYLAYRQTEIKRDGYRENVPGFPVEYGAANLKDNALAVGAKFALPITPKLSWISAVEFERRLGGESPIYRAKAQYVGDVRYQPDLNHSRWNAQSGVRYAFAPNLSLSLTPFWGNSIVGNNQWGTRLTLEGRF